VTHSNGRPAISSSPARNYVCGVIPHFKDLFMDTSNLFSHPEKHETMPTDERPVEPAMGPLFSDRPHPQHRSDKRSS
jgi:hypothetical protein